MKASATCRGQPAAGRAEREPVRGTGLEGRGRPHRRRTRIGCQRASVYPDDANAAIPAPGYAIVNARVQAKQQLGQWRLKQFVRVNNLFDRRYVGSVIVGESNKRYYEAAPGRNWLLGVSAQYQFR